MTGVGLTLTPALHSSASWSSLRLPLSLPPWCSLSTPSSTTCTARSRSRASAIFLNTTKASWVFYVADPSNLNNGVLCELLFCEESALDARYPAHYNATASRPLHGAEVVLEPS